MQYDIIIGIDPDAERDGIAVLETETRRLNIGMYTFGKTLALLDAQTVQARAAGKKLTVVVEGGWLNSGNFHLTQYDTIRTAARKGLDQGRNHQRGLDIVAYCEFAKIPCQVVKPLQKSFKGYHLWNGKDGKITQEELKAITGQELGRINQEGRDAALIAWTFAGLPTIVNKTLDLRAKDKQTK